MKQIWFANELLSDETDDSNARVILCGNLSCKTCHFL